MRSELTPWFPASVKPARKGWYEVGSAKVLHHRSPGHLTGRPFRYWTGHRWVTASPSASWSFTSIFGEHSAHQWRGLAKKP